MRILLLSKYGRLGASSRVRSFQYLPYLEAEGFRVDVHSLLDDTYLRTRYEGGRTDPVRVALAGAQRVRKLARSSAYDLVWIEKELFPWLPAWAEPLLGLLGVPYVVDYDDAIFHNYDRHRSPVVRTLLGRKIDAVMRAASLVIVGNPYLAARARAAGARDVVELPSVVEAAAWAPSPPRDGTGLTIGWIGTPATTKFLRNADVGKALARVGQLDGVRFVLVGAAPVGWSEVAIEVRPWSEATEVRDVREFDVGIMPVEDDDWSRGKCGYKLIQYMAAAKPVVASPVGANCQIVRHGVNGFLASTTEEWVAALESLRSAPELRTAMGRAGRDTVEQAYSLEVTAPILARLLRRAAEGSGP